MKNISCEDKHFMEYFLEEKPLYVDFKKLLPKLDILACMYIAEKLSKTEKIRSTECFTQTKSSNITYKLPSINASSQDKQDTMGFKDDLFSYLTLLFERINIF